MKCGALEELVDDGEEVTDSSPEKYFVSSDPQSVRSKYSNGMRKAGPRRDVPAA